MRYPFFLTSIALVTFFMFYTVNAQSNDLQLKTKSIISKIERRILEQEKEWRLSKKEAGSNFSLNTWVLDKGSINVTIVNYATPEKAREDFNKGKGTTSTGTSRDISGFGDAAYENGNTGGVSSLILVKGTTIIGIESNLLPPKDQPIIKRFARHILDTMEGK